MMTARKLTELREAGKITDHDYVLELYKLMTPEERERFFNQAREIYLKNGWEWPEE
ncbi:MAG: hypothetical protein AB1894_29550 [Chloroflexota bacterium]